MKPAYRSAHNRALDFRIDDDFRIKHLMQDRILVRPIKADPAAVIVRLESNLTKPTRGQVLAVGPGKVNGKGVLIPMDVKVGDVIVFGPHATTDILLRGESLLITREENVFGVDEEAALVQKICEAREIMDAQPVPDDATRQCR